MGRARSAKAECVMPHWCDAMPARFSCSGGFFCGKFFESYSEEDTDPFLFSTATGTSVHNRESPGIAAVRIYNTIPQEGDYDVEARSLGNYHLVWGLQFDNLFLDRDAGSTPNRVIPAVLRAGITPNAERRIHAIDELWSA